MVKVNKSIRHFITHTHNGSCKGQKEAEDSYCTWHQRTTLRKQRKAKKKIKSGGNV